MLFAVVPLSSSISRAFQTSAGTSDAQLPLCNQRRFVFEPNKKAGWCAHQVLHDTINVCLKASEQLRSDNKEFCSYSCNPRVGRMNETVWESHDFSYMQDILPVVEYYGEDRASANAKIPDGFINPVANISKGFLLKDLNISKACGFPGFCSSSAAVACRNVTLMHCGQCHAAGGIIYITLTTLLGLVVILGNAFVVYFTVTQRSGFTGPYNWIRASLATADIFAGTQM